MTINTPDSRQIIAVSSGGFTYDDLLIDQYILKHSKKENPRICFLPTASGDSESYTGRFYQAMNALPCKPSHLSLFKPHTSDIRGFLLDQEIIYIGAGCARNLISIIKEWELDKVFKEAWEHSVVLAGVNAGAIVWFNQGMESVFPKEYLVTQGLGFISGSLCPEYNSNENIPLHYNRFIQGSNIRPGLGVDAGVALHYSGTQLFTSVAINPDIKSYRIRYENGGLKKETIKPQHLSPNT